MTIAHVSDLHFGAGARLESGARRLARHLEHAPVDLVIVTGDITHRGLRRELEDFEAAFEPLASAGRLLVVPGNHDRLGDDLVDEITGGERVRVRAHPSVYTVLVDSTGPHNRLPFAAHGKLDASDLRELDAALSRAPEGAHVVVAMHHHAFPLPTESALERLSSMLGLPYAAELACGAEMLELLASRCDLLLHGHRHVPRTMTIPGARPLGVFNAGCSSELGRVRVLECTRAAPGHRVRWLGSRVDPAARARSEGSAANSSA